MEITFKEIMDANAAIRTTDIKGKEYAEVNQRIKAFRMVYPTGFINTNIFELKDGVVTIRAEVGFYDENGNIRVLGKGTAYEKENSSFINKTSYIENCETSAVGRALGMAGFGIDTSVASYEEVANAIENQKKAEPITGKEVIKLKTLIEEYPANEPYDTRVEKICQAYHVSDLKELTSDQYVKLIKQLEGKK